MTGGSEMSVELFDEGEVWADEEDLLGSEEDLGVEVLSPEEAISYIQHADSSPLYEHYRVIADKGQALLRVDKFLASRMTGFGWWLRLRQWSSCQGQLPHQTTGCRHTPATTP